MFFLLPYFCSIGFVELCYYISLFCLFTVAAWVESVLTLSNVLDCILCLIDKNVIFCFGPFRHSSCFYNQWCKSYFCILVRKSIVIKSIVWNKPCVSALFLTLFMVRLTALCSFFVCSLSVFSSVLFVCLFVCSSSVRFSVLFVCSFVCSSSVD